MLRSGYQHLKTYIAEDDGKQAGVVVTMRDKWDCDILCFALSRTKSRPSLQVLWNSRIRSFIQLLAREW